MRFLATSFGSAGDFLPTLAVARALTDRGHEVVFVTNPFHERAIRRAGVGFVPAGEHLDLYALIRADPQVLETLAGVPVLLELSRPFVTQTYLVAKQLLAETWIDGVIGSNLSFGLFWAALERKVPMVMIAATAIGWISHGAPTQFLDFPIPDWLLAPLAGATHALVYGVANHGLRSLSRSIGPTSFDASATAIEAKLALHLGMWPELLRPATQADPPNSHACGFTHAGHLADTATALAPELLAFLAAGPPPVVVGLGSIYSLASDDVVADAAEACAELGQRCVIVGAAPRGRELPVNTLVVPYATYHLLFPRASALVIHGGAGTTGEALRSGVPCVVVPFAFDQFGLAWQVDRLGVGVRTQKRGRSRQMLRAAIERALHDEPLQRRAKKVAAELAAQPDGALVAAERIARTLSRPPR